jgi:thioesterase domain-containing protein
MAELYVNEIKKVKPKGPYAVGGYCMGGMVALAMAQLFYAQGDEVPFLGMIESYNVRGYGYTPDKFKDIISGIQNIYYHISNTYHAGTDRKGFIRDKYVTETKRIELKLRLISGRIHSLWNSSKTIEFPHFQLSSINDAAYYAYVPSKFNGLISVYRPRTSFFRHNAVTCGWDAVSDKLEIYEISSRPRGMLVEPFVKELSSRLQKSLNDVKVRLKSSS